MKFFLFTYLIVFVAAFSLPAQNRQYKKETIEELRGKHSYDEEPEQYEEHNSPSTSTSSDNVSLPIFNSGFLVVFGIIILAFLIFILFGKNSGVLFNTQKELDFDELTIEETPKSELEKMLDNALRQQDYKVAIRALYLLTLKHLADSSIILLKEDKTNFDYYYEIKKHDSKQLFKSITSIYDYVWYGEFEALETHYDTTSSYYKQLSQQTK